jgi:hypothetical protein
MNVDAAAESPDSAVFTSGLRPSEYRSVACTTPHAAIIATVLITIDGMRPFESDAFYGPINVGGLK